MATFDVGHPDVMDFIRAKREDGRLRQFNLSLLITQEFMDAVNRDGDWKLLRFADRSAESVRADLVAQRAYADPERLGGPRAVPVPMSERADDRVALEGLEIQGRWRGGRRCIPAGQLLQRTGLAVRLDQEGAQPALEPVPVARKAVSGEQLQQPSVSSGAG